jgi:hypothetical protein
VSQVNVNIDNQPIGMIPQKDPSYRGVYDFGITDVIGIVAANNYMTIVNPVGSGRLVVPTGIFISCYIASGASSTRNSLQGLTATAVSGGTLASSSAITKFDSTYPNAVAEVRSGSVTATPGSNVFNSPPPIGPTAATYVHSVGYGASTGAGGFFLRPGEGLVFRTATGNINQTWNMSITWGEI